MESYRPKRSVVKKVLTYNINYHQIGYYEQRELQKALKNSLLEAEKASKKDNLIDDKSNELTTDLTANELIKSDLTNDKQSTDLTKESNNQFKQSINNIIDQILNQPFEDLPIDKNENSSFKVNTKEIDEQPTKKLKLDKKSIKTNKKTKNDKLEFNYKDKFKKLDKFDNELLIKLKDVEKEFKKCKDKLINDQVTNVFNSDKKGDLNDLQINLINKQEIDLDDQLEDNFDLNNLISSLIDKLDENNSIDSSDDFKDTSNELFNNNLNNNQILDKELIMVSNKNSSSLTNSIKIKKELNDKHLLNNHKTSTNKTNGNTNGHHLIDDNLESQFNSTNKKKNKKLKKDKNVNKKPRKAKSNVSSLLDFHFEFDDNKSNKDDLFSLNSFDDLSSKQECTNSYSSSSSSSSTSIKSASNKSTASSSKSTTTTTTTNNKSTTKKPTKPKSKLFTIRNCIKNEIRQKLLHKSMLLTKNKISTKNGKLTNGLDKSKKKSKLNGTTKTETNGLSSSKYNDLLSPNKLETNGKLKKQKKKNIELTPTKSTKKLKKDDKQTTPIKNKKPRTPHLIKEPKRKRRSKELIRRSNLLIRNLYKFRQYLKFKKQELLNLDRDELTALNVISKDLMYCFIDNSNNFEIDCDIYDPLTVSGLLEKSQPFNELNSKSILSNDLLLDNLLPNLTDDKPTTNGFNEMNFDSTTEEDDISELWTSAPSSPI